MDPVEAKTKEKEAIDHDSEVVGYKSVHKGRNTRINCHNITRRHCTLLSIIYRQAIILGQIMYMCNVVLCDNIDIVIYRSRVV